MLTCSTVSDIIMIQDRILAAGDNIVASSRSYSMSNAAKYTAKNTAKYIALSFCLGFRTLLLLRSNHGHLIPSCQNFVIIFNDVAYCMLTSANLNDEQTILTAFASNLETEINNQRWSR